MEYGIAPTVVMILALAAMVVDTAPQVYWRSGADNFRSSTSAPYVRQALTPCAKAIVICCSDDRVINTGCSSLVGCGEHFFDNPCDERFLTAALAVANGIQPNNYV